MPGVPTLIVAPVAVAARPGDVAGVAFIVAAIAVINLNRWPPLFELSSAARL